MNEVQKVAFGKGITTTQLALAWTIAKGALPIPGTRRISYLEQNIAATEHSLSQMDLDRLESIIPITTKTGNRYGNMSSID